MSAEQNQLNEDRRVSRTKQFISGALLELLQEKRIEDIAIKDITERANVNRSTFYAYYSDKFDLLDQMTKAKLDELSRLLIAGNAAAYLPDYNEPDPFFSTLFDHLEENEPFYIVLFTRLGPASAANDYPNAMFAVIRDAFYARISSLGMSQKQAVPVDLLLDHISFSTFHSAKKWMEQRMIYSSRHMALQLTRLSILGGYRAMGFVVS
ncbi:TetR/AcrR family transcriptional regulator [Paenibacillus radicis (ex Gao et al. 2016)]|uniref:TetR family transcriptional regulator n=1 Tax=Paenibacillus radicis (ex Gao et al. 2016) TaxID=1737354 RepID=A0A917HSW6_9BACL|nr:TetR/AcrR family transcriptional regulator [Paenibacillus radicis (ex Gao et al. 2016)]GGG89274.1 TetR family transcriptional regulator [Paenibacillus radicis (ex Gao et al. 2016)]